jgi:hypothetical protein
MFLDPLIHLLLYHQPVQISARDVSRQMPHYLLALIVLRAEQIVFGWILEMEVELPWNTEWNGRGFSINRNP